MSFARLVSSRSARRPPCARSGLDIHRDFWEVAIAEEGRVRAAGRIGTAPAEIEAVASGLRPGDTVTLEATGNALAIVRILEPHVRVVLANPKATKAATRRGPCLRPADPLPLQAPRDRASHRRSPRPGPDPGPRRNRGRARARARACRPSGGGLRAARRRLGSRREAGAGAASGARISRRSASTSAAGISPGPALRFGESPAPPRLCAWSRAAARRDLTFIGRSRGTPAGARSSRRCRGTAGRRPIRRAGS